MNKCASPKWDKWRKSLEQVKKELDRLYFAKGMFERLNSHKKVANCPNLCFSLYLNNTYVVYLAMAIRRLTDKRSNAQNIYQLLEDFKKNACDISIDNYADYYFEKIHKNRIENHHYNKGENKLITQSYLNDLRNEAKKLYESSLGGKTNKLLCCDVQKDINKLKKITLPIENLSDKYWAHMDKPSNKSSLGSIKFGEAHQAFDALVDIFNKYSPLLGILRFEPDDKVLFGGWKSIFR
ncbi:MAG: hypothetical protein WC374_11565 [Phycisphaerae bacterium]|jgi:hypothetical protein